MRKLTWFIAVVLLCHTAAAQDYLPFPHDAHVPENWGDGKSPELERDCRGCHDRDPLSTCAGCHYDAQKAASALEVVPAAKTVEGVFHHADHAEKLECRACHSIVGKQMTIPRGIE